MTTVEVTQLIDNQGALLIFLGTDVGTGGQVTFAADQRAARPLADAIITGETPEVEIPEYLILARPA